MNLAAFLTAFAADRLSKEWANKKLSENETQTVVSGRLYFRKVRNYGFSNNVMSKKPELVKTASTAAMLVSLLYAVLGLKNASKPEKAAFSLMLGGGLSNLTDRYINGYVTDFICFKKGRTTIFNIADFFIFAGAAFFTAFSILRKQ